MVEVEGNWPCPSGKRRRGEESAAAPRDGTKKLLTNTWLPVDLLSKRISEEERYALCRVVSARGEEKLVGPVGLDRRRRRVPVGIDLPSRGTQEIVCPVDIVKLL